MSQTINDIDIFKLTTIQDRPATMYHHESEDSTYLYVGAERFDIPQGGIYLCRPGDHPLNEKFRGFRFRQDVKLDGYVIVFQMDEHYMVMFATEKFTNQENEPDAVNDIILLKVGNALQDVETLS